MSSYRRPGREDVAAALVAVVVIAAGIVFWLRREGHSTAPDGTTTHARALDAAFPINLQLRTGNLSNGLTYFVRANKSPDKRAELRLVVNAGSVLEADDQRGLAHGVEHMLFRGTRNFPKRAVDEYFQSIGMRCGRDVNAHTGRDETVYTVTVPTDRPGVLDTAIAILADMAHNATFDPNEAKTEAGIVFEEWRSSSGARRRMIEQRDSILLGGSRYGNHTTIGDTAVLRRFDVHAMRRFYDDWYRPELMAIAVVGDFDAQAVERLVKKHFGSIPKSPVRHTRPTIAVQPARAPRVAMLTDTEATGTRVSVWFPRRATPRLRVADYRTELVAELWRDVLNARLEDAADLPGSPLLDAGVSGRQLVRSLNAEVVSGAIVEDSSAAALDVLVGEVSRLARTGPTPAELTKHANALLKQRRHANEFLDDSDDLVESYVDEFLDGDVAIDRELDEELANDLIPTITIADIRAAARRASIDNGALLVVSGPTRKAVASATSTDLIARARVASSRAANPRAASLDSVTLIPHLPTPGSIASEALLLESYAIDWKLSNGMRVILKPTSFARGQVEFRLVGSGGASLASDADYPSAYLSDDIVRSTGIGPLSGVRLARLIDESSIRMSQSVTDDAISFTGHSSASDLETLFQVLHLYFTAPRTDTAAFRRYVERARSFSAHSGADPDIVFYDSVAVATTNRHKRAIRHGSSFINAVTLTKALSFWNARVANAAGFTLVMSGDFTTERVRPLVTRFLASLPAGVREQPRDDGMRFPTGVVRRDIHAGIGPRAKTQIVLSGPFDFTSESGDALTNATDVAEHVLENQLRETLGGTYGVSVSSDVNLVPPIRYSITVEFEASPERIDSLADVALAELKRLSSRGPTQRELEKTRIAGTRDLDDKLQENDYWATELSWHARMGWPLAGITAHQKAAEHLTLAALREACAKYLGTAQYARVTMYPKLAASR